MNSTIWKKFLDDSKKLSKPAQAKQIISGSDVIEIKLLLIEVLNGFLAKKDLHVGLKIYLGQELRNDYIEKMVANPPRMENSLKKWSQEIFGNQNLV